MADCPTRPDTSDAPSPQRHWYEIAWRRSAVTMQRNGRAVVLLTDGADAEGPVISTGYRRAERVIRRPISKGKGAR